MAVLEDVGGPRTSPFEVVIERIAVYLASPITSRTSRERKRNSAIRDRIKEELDNYQKVDFDVYDPHDHTNLGSPHSPREVFRIDIQKVVESDLIIAVTGPTSQGVAIEVLAAALTVLPSVFITPKDCVDSRLLDGVPTVTLADILSVSPKTIAPRLAEKLPGVAERVLATRAARRTALKQSVSTDFGLELLKLRLQKGLSREKLSMRSGIAVQLIELYETHPLFGSFVNQFQLTLLGNELEFSCRSLGARQSGPTIRPVDELDVLDRKSLSSLAEFVRTHRPPDEERVLALWQSHLEARNAAVAARSPMDEPNTVDDWLHAYGVPLLMSAPVAARQQ